MEEVGLRNAFSSKAVLTKGKATTAPPVKTAAPASNPIIILARRELAEVLDWL
jgi:hypothetical protein